MSGVQPWQLFGLLECLHMLHRNKHRNPNIRGFAMLLFRMLFVPKTPQPAHMPHPGNADATFNHLLLLCKGRA